MQSRSGQGADGRVRLQGLTKRYGAVEAVQAVDLDIPPGTFFALLGPSGCGKSTLLRMIAGLEEPTEGRILIDDQDVTDQPAQRRPTAMVFQSYALFPSMTVLENVEYGLKVRRVDKSERAKRVGAALERVGLEGLASRSVTQLSGGQQQRVALARALVVEPKVMLFDEPLSNLDVALRERTRMELRTLQESLGTTSVYVTHDQEEAMAVSDLVAVMRAGSIVQVGSPEGLYGEPDTAYVASFLGGSNLIGDSGLAERLAGESVPAGAVLSVRPEDLRLDSEGSPFRILARQFLGAPEWNDWLLGHESGERLRVRLPADASLGESPRFAAASVRWVRDDR